ncbi:DUF1269 domain-containing protein [Caballeronia cordobensis]|uniref:Membrane protein n=1 Tax=Caballeronia cordobensis TaxID=1353886 RepID=A0A158J7P1_CABCO|nr:DUF1269 domain-containing protein [Caballeronia cordobensis]BAO88280.1 membrane protein [Burkholderia sp. RPE67]SAL64894.1 membrane protein [Caballeronia cordobensis]
MSSHLIIATFSSVANAEQASREIQRFASEDEGLTIHSGVLVQKGSDGNTNVLATQSRAIWGPVIGAITGTLLGLLGGPAGALLGFTVGTSAGIAQQLISDVLDDESVKSTLTLLPAGQVVLILEADEDSPAHVDALIAASRGSVVRRDL